jgi:uncharacterized protein (DUF1800 family)
MLNRASSSWTLFDAAHLLNRAGFGGSPAEIQKLHELGRAKAVESLLRPDEPIDAFPIPEWGTEQQAALDLSARARKQLELRKASRNLSAEEAENQKREFRRAEQREERQRTLEAQGWWFQRILNSKAPLREKMTLFWHDHFATSFQKVKIPVLLIRQNELFRSHAFGSFRDLTHAVHMDPAMMLYLDSQNSKKDKPNENFPREVMELFTLGEGNYTEQDIHEAARAFTGYRINRKQGKVVHFPSLWDSSQKTIFGKSGPFNGTDVIHLIFEKKEAARFMSKKLWEFFVNDNPSAATLDHLANLFQKADFQITPLLREIFLSEEFYSGKFVRCQIKCPVQYIASLLKQMDIHEPPAGFPVTAQIQLGQILFAPPNVAGWDWGQAWINTNTLLTRYNLAGWITKGAGDTPKSGNEMKVKGMATAQIRMGRGWKGPDYETLAARPLRENPTDLVDSLIFRFFQAPLPEKARSSFIEYAESKKGVIFTNKEVAELCHLILSTPYYQLC